MTPLHIAALYTGSIARGAGVTVRLTLIGTAIGLGIGVLGAAARLRERGLARAVATAYVEVIRGTPQILQLFIVFFGLSQFRINLSPGAAALVWLALYGGGYGTEVLRAGLQSVEHGQHEAAAALGLSPARAMLRVILPQAVAVVLPALTNFLVLQLKAASLLFTIGVAGIMYEAQLGVNTTTHPGVLFSMAAVAFIIINVPLSRLGIYLERRVAAYR
jgi:His/Glu/Gln/Arg/opine family amino acid ABC transporter permease subunit